MALQWQPCSFYFPLVILSLSFDFGNVHFGDTTNPGFAVLDLSFGSPPIDFPKEFRAAAGTSSTNRFDLRAIVQRQDLIGEQYAQFNALQVDATQIRKDLLELMLGKVVMLTSDAISTWIAA